MKGKNNFTKLKSKMRKIIASINITPDGFCDHTAATADEELHEHFNKLFRNVDAALLGKVTYQLMESAWPPLVEKPSGLKAIDEFAILMDTMPKIVFSKTLKTLPWKNSHLAVGSLNREVEKLKQQSGKNILAGGPSILSQLTKFGLIDEYQFLVHPILAGKGKRFFETLNLESNRHLKLINTKTLNSGVIILSYQSANINND